MSETDTWYQVVRVDDHGQIAWTSTPSLWDKAQKVAQIRSRQLPEDSTSHYEIRPIGDQ